MKRHQGRPPKGSRARGMRTLTPHDSLPWYWPQAEEWDRDGQYYHYLTKWALALLKLGQHAGEQRYLCWAADLLTGVHHKFVYSTGSGPRMVWKAAVDLSRALVPSQGLHDPLDGFITLQQVQAALASTSASAAPDMAGPLGDFRAMIAGKDFATADSLGLGGLLVDCHRLQALARGGRPELAGLALQLLASAQIGLVKYASSRALSRPVEHRLAFRELGLSLGLGVLQHLHAAVELESNREFEGLLGLIEGLLGYEGLREQIEETWIRPEARRQATWVEHQDINDVMLAASLLPSCVLI